MKQEWIWLERPEAIAIHDEQLAEHGGLSGIRDTGLLEAALARLQQIAAYDETADVCALAAAYAYAMVRNHPFLDGNKRTGFVLMELFLMLNGYSCTADDAECVAVMLDAAAGTLPEDKLVAWLRANTAPL